ncbi:MAG: IS30 family transposase [Lachnospiraceae bacterium]|nr:IS30 family transposase [Lachnospiraceae bacterium]
MKHKVHKIKLKNYITEEDRYKIELKLRQKKTIPQIADELCIKYHTLRKEIIRGTVTQRDTNLVDKPVYLADYAQRVIDENLSRRGRGLKIGYDVEFIDYAEAMIKNKYSPEALLLKAKNDGMKFQSPVCAKTIYNYLDDGRFENITNKDLPQKKDDFRKKKAKKRKVSLNNLTGTSIDKRPKLAGSRTEYGHWEIDTVYGAKGSGKSCLLVLTERMTREEIIIKMGNRKSLSVVRAFDKLEKQLGVKAFRSKFKTIAADNGVEFLDYARLEKSKYGKGKRTKIYYCHPYASYERGSCENANRLIRRFFPKGTNFDMVTNRQVKMVEAWVNTYPRKLFGGISSNGLREQLKISA